MGGILNFIDKAISGLSLTDEADDQFHLLREAYEKDEDGNDPMAIIDKAHPVPGSWSMFNPFKIFRYSKFGMSSTYNKELQFDKPSSSLSPTDMASLAGIGSKSYSAPTENEGTTTVNDLSSIGQTFKLFSDTRNWMENPSASNIIEWSQLQTSADGTVITPTPYTPTDFLWCTHYGKVPNNRLVTLRRYPLPVEDNLAIKPEKSPLIPIAQAVTWYGADIENPLSSILNLNWGLNWKEKSSTVQDITGNEISVEDIAAAVGIEDETTIQILKTQVFSGSDGKVDILKLAGYDASIQEYIREAYQDGGPYWNRILGPVNVIDRTLIRDRGFKDQNPITIKFQYSLRAYAGINPKIAFLDLYSNFLSLTYNTAPFWGGGARYFQKTGITLPGFGIENEMLSGDVASAISMGAEQIQQAAMSNIKELAEFAKSISEGKFKGKAITAERKRLDKKFGDTVLEGQTDPISKLLAPRLGQVLRKPLIYRAILDGRAVGEWHVTIGNPMNPMAVMGNLCLDTVNLEFGEILGIDDFPTEFTFTVKLSHGRPRAKQDLESIFNLGNGALGFSQLAQPSSASNSYGERTSNRLNNALPDGISIPVNDSAVPGDKLTQQVQNVINIQTGNNGGVSEYGTQNAPTNTSLANGMTIENLVERYSTRVNDMYGEGFGKSPILKDYFSDLKTKD